MSKSNTALARVVQSADLARVETQVLAMLPIKRDELKQIEADARADLKIAKAGTIETDDDLADANAWLLETLAAAKALEAMRKKASEPLNKVRNALQSLVTPAAKPLGELVSVLKGKIGEYQLARANEQRQLYAAASEQLESISHEELSEALSEAQAAAPAKLEGLSTGFKWIVKRFVIGMLPEEWIIPATADVAALEAHAKQFTDEPPIIPGVIWERVADVRATGRH